MPIAVDWSQKRTPGHALVEHKEAARGRIMRLSGDVRAKYLSIIPGQEMIYLAKEGEAIAILAGEPGDYPFLSAEVGETGETIEQVAQVVLNLAAAWRAIGAEIEGLRVRANAAVRAAQNDAEVDAALAAFLEGIAAW